MRVLQIVPRLPPNIDGIGDYAIFLASRLRQDHDIHTSFLVADPLWQGPQVIDGFDVTRLNVRTSNHLASVLQRFMESYSQDSIPVLLQFAPYAYQARGCPHWLLDGLVGYSTGATNNLLTMFHELENERGWPWRSPFWLRDVQRIIVRRLAKMSAFNVTNAAVHARRLAEWNILNVPLLPSFSTIGEPTINSPVCDRHRQIVVFGRAWQREQAYKKGLLELRRVADQVGAEKIIDIGSPISGHNVSKIGHIPVVRRGALPANDVSAEMGASLASFIYYPYSLLTKSSTYAASCAHGTIPFVASDCKAQRLRTELVDGMDFVSVSLHREKPAPFNFDRLSADVFSRYHDRSSVSSARIFARIISSLTWNKCP